MSNTSIDPRDLTVGSWVLHPTGKVIQVAGILENRFHKNMEVYYDFEQKDGALCIVSLSDCSPIPLSESVLLACGFEKIDGAWSLHRNYYSHIEFVKNTGTDLYGVQIADMIDVRLEKFADIEYLHELQMFWRGSTRRALKINPAALKEAARKEGVK